MAAEAPPQPLVRLAQEGSHIPADQKPPQPQTPGQPLNMFRLLASPFSTMPTVIVETYEPHREV